MTELDVKQMLVRICDPKHPHYPEHGRLTDKVISVLGTPMAEVTLASCVHGTDGCFVKKGQIEAVDEMHKERGKGRSGRRVSHTSFRQSSR